MKKFLLVCLLLVSCQAFCAEPTAKARLSHVVYFVSDVKESLDFYRRVFGFTIQNADERGFYGELDCGGYVLAFCSEKLAEMQLPGGFRKVNPADQPFGCEIGFVTEDVQGYYDKALQEGATSVAAPDKKPWGQIIAYVRDPQGILIELCYLLPN